MTNSILTAIYTCVQNYVILFAQATKSPSCKSDSYRDCYRDKSAVRQRYRRNERSTNVAILITWNVWMPSTDTHTHTHKYLMVGRMCYMEDLSLLNEILPFIGYSMFIRKVVIQPVKIRLQISLSSLHFRFSVCVFFSIKFISYRKCHSQKNGLNEAWHPTFRRKSDWNNSILNNDGSERVAQHVCVCVFCWWCLRNGIRRTVPAFLLLLEIYSCQRA